MTFLCDEHMDKLVGLGLPPDLVRSAGYRSVLTKPEQEDVKRDQDYLDGCGFAKVSRGPGIVIPILTQTGQPSGCQLIRDDPRSTPRGAKIRRERTRGLKGLHWPKDSLCLHEQPGAPLFVVADPLLADLLAHLQQPAVAVVQHANSGRIPDELHTLCRAGRKIYSLLPDKAARVLKRFDGIFLAITEPNGESAWTVLARGGVDALLDCAKKSRKPDHCYPIGTSGFEIVYETTRGLAREPLTTFVARVTKEITLTGSDKYGLDSARELEIEASVFDPVQGQLVQRPPIQVSAEEYAAMKWLQPKLGFQALIHAGQGNVTHCAHAIAEHSTPESVTVHKHTGWARLASGWSYLHAGGAIGQNGPVDGVETRLEGRLQHVVMEPDPMDAEDVRAMLRLLHLCPKATVPLVAYVFRSLLSWTNVTFMLYGHSGRFKTELIALGQAHLGRDFNSGFLLKGWNSTPNSIEQLLYCGKDLPVGVDDYRSDEHNSRGFCQVVRSQANGEGRGRLDRNSRTKVTYDPRGGLMSSGEHLVGPLSVTARMCAIRMQQGDIPIDPETERSVALDHCRDDAASGAYVRFTTRFLQWLAAEIDRAGSPLDLLRELRERASALRATGGHHRRTAEVDLELRIGLILLFRFLGLESGSQQGSGLDLHLPESVLVELREIPSLAEHNLDTLYKTQAGLLHRKRPGVRFLESLRSALHAGRAHVTFDGGPRIKSSQHSLLGYRKSGSRFDAQGECVGQLCLKEDVAYVALDFGVAQAVVRDFSRREGEPIDEDKETILEDLEATGAILVTSEKRSGTGGKTRNRRTHQVPVGGERVRRPLLRLDRLLDDERQPDSEESKEGRNGWQRV